MTHLKPIAVGLLFLLFLLTGCRSMLQSPGSDTGLLKASGIHPGRPGKDLRRGKRAALLAFNSMIYTDPEGTQPKSERTAVTAAEMRELTDAMLHTFLDELRRVKALQLLPVSRSSANRYYPRLSGRWGSQIAGFSLTEAQGLRAAPQPLKYIKIAKSRGQQWLRAQTEGLKLDTILAKLIGGSPRRDDEVGAEDLALVSYKLGTDFVVLVNNRVRLTAGADGVWRARLELLEVVVVGTSELKDFAYAKYVEGDFSDGNPELAGDPTKPEVWELMRYRPRTKEGEEPMDLSQRDFAKTPFWPQIAAPYRRLAGAFRDDLNAVRRLP